MSNFVATIHHCCCCSEASSPKCSACFFPYKYTINRLFLW